MTQTVERMLPLYEAKMIHQYDHRWATYEPDGTVRDVTLVEKQDPSFVALPRYWVREEVVQDRLPGTGKDWMLGYRWISNATNERTLIAAKFPRTGTGNSLPIFAEHDDGDLVVAAMSSFVCDYVARQKLGGQNVTFGTVYQLAIPGVEKFLEPSPWAPSLPIATWIRARLHSLDNWPIPDRRYQVKAELDAAFFHLFGIAREDVDYIMDTFPIVKRKDEAAFGSYRTKELILEVFDAMQAAIEAGVPYASSFDNPGSRPTEKDETF
ncbi:MAG: hypothetical protein GX454_00910 [Brooklawnia sp.]|nr:hypothetical protein [Brooklawnia sp.]